MTSAFIAGILWYFPGFGAGELPAVDKERLKTFFSADQVVCKCWCSSYATWEESVAKVNIVSQSVVTEIQSLKPDERKDIVLVGHSLGGRVVAYSLAKLGELGISIHAAVLLAPAISSGDQYASKLCRGCNSIILVVGENDLVLKWIYPFVANGTSAMETIDDLDAESKYSRYVVPDQYIWRQNQLLPSHNASMYIEYLSKVRRSGRITKKTESSHHDERFWGWRFHGDSFATAPKALTENLADALDAASCASTNAARTISITANSLIQKQRRSNRQ